MTQSVPFVLGRSSRTHWDRLAFFNVTRYQNQAVKTISTGSVPRELYTTFLGYTKPRITQFSLITTFMQHGGPDVTERPVALG